MQRVLSILTAGREVIQTELIRIERDIAELSARPDATDNPSIAELNRGREERVAEVKWLDESVAIVKNGGGHSVSESALKPVSAGQYAGMKLTVATQAFLTERGGGPLQIMKIVEGLIAGGCKIAQTRSKYHKAEPPRDPNARDLRRQANSNRPRYVYDLKDETLALRTGGADGITTWKTSKRDRAAELRES